MKTTAIAASALALGLLSSTAPTRALAADNVHTEERNVPVQHVIVTTPKNYADVCAFIEGKLGRFDQPMRDMLKNGQADQLREAAAKIIQNYGLSIHYISYHGKLLMLNGPERDLKAYYIGDLLSASKMTRTVPAAGLYAPLRIVVYKNDAGGTTIEYDRPSTLFGQFHQPVTDQMGPDLDKRMEALLHDATH